MNMDRLTCRTVCPFCYASSLLLNAVAHLRIGFMGGGLMGKGLDYRN